MTEGKNMNEKYLKEYEDKWVSVRVQGQACHYGIGEAVDYAKAIMLYEMAAEHGDRVAQRELGLMYLRGEGVEQNHAEAFVLLLEAAGPVD